MQGLKHNIVYRKDENLLIYEWKRIKFNPLSIDNINILEEDFFEKTMEKRADRKERQLKRLNKKLERLDKFLETAQPRNGLSGDEVKSNVKDNES